MRTSHCRLPALTAALFAAALASTSHATTVDITGYDNWYQFDIDDLYSQSGGTEWIDGYFDDQGQYTADGSALSFSLTLTEAAQLTIVDAGFGGDQFKVTINGQNYFSSIAANTYDSSIGADFDAALADGANYSYLNIVLGAGTYLISGELAVSALDDNGQPLNATVGALRVSEVPVPAAAWLFGSALVAGLGAVRRRRR